MSPLLITSDAITFVLTANIKCLKKLHQIKNSSTTAHSTIVSITETHTISPSGHNGSYMIIMNILEPHRGGKNQP